MREAPRRVLVAELIARGACIRAYDPVARPEAQRVFRGENSITFVDHAMDAVDGADLLAIVTEWEEFRNPDFAAIKARLKMSLIFDGRNLYDPVVPRKFGLEYYAIGRP
jgi:UDPglucose 6-dehydrogenase